MVQNFTLLSAPGKRSRSPFMTHLASSPKSISRSLISTSCTKSCRRNIYEDHKAQMGRNVNLFIYGHQICLKENTTSALKTQRFVLDHSRMWKVQYKQIYQGLLQLDINISTHQILRWLLDVALEDVFAWWLSKSSLIKKPTSLYIWCTIMDDTNRPWGFFVLQFFNL